MPRSLAVISPCSQSHVKFAADCASSVEALKQSAPFKVEWIVACEPSVSKTQKGLELADKVIIAPSPTGLGPSRLRNLALQRCDYADYIFPLDIDDSLIPKTIIKAVGFLDKHPELACLGLNILRLKNKKFDGIPHFKIVDKIFEIEEFNEIWRSHDYRVKTALPFANNVVVIRKSVLQAIGNWYQGLKICEDVELLVRINRFFKVATSQEAGIYYRKHPEAATQALDWKSRRDRIRSILINLDYEFSQTKFKG